jgi:hypothetical protein
MTSKVAVKANAGNFAFDGDDRNEGWQTQTKNGAVLKVVLYGSHTNPGCLDENHFTVSRTGEMGVLWSPSLKS